MPSFLDKLFKPKAAVLATSASAATPAPSTTPSSAPATNAFDCNTSKKRLGHNLFLPILIEYARIETTVSKTNKNFVAESVRESAQCLVVVLILTDQEITRVKLFEACWKLWRSLAGLYYGSRLQSSLPNLDPARVNSRAVTVKYNYS